MQRKWVPGHLGSLIALIALAAGFCSPAIAVELRADPGGAAAGDTVVTSPEVEIPFRLDNDSLEKAELTLIARSVRVSGANPASRARAAQSHYI